MPTIFCTRFLFENVQIDAEDGKSFRPFQKEHLQCGNPGFVEVPGENQDRAGPRAQGRCERLGGLQREKALLPRTPEVHPRNLEAELSGVLHSKFKKKPGFPTIPNLRAVLFLSAMST